MLELKFTDRITTTVVNVSAGVCFIYTFINWQTWGEMTLCLLHFGYVFTVGWIINGCSVLAKTLHMLPQRFLFVQCS